MTKMEMLLNRRNHRFEHGMNSNREQAREAYYYLKGMAAALELANEITPTAELVNQIDVTDSMWFRIGERHGFSELSDANASLDREALAAQKIVTMKA